MDLQQDKQNKKVEFLCIGAQKGGTTWLNEQLLQHSEVYLPPIKEVHYFNYLYSLQDRNWIPNHYQRPARIRIKQQIEKIEEIGWDDIAYYAELMKGFEDGIIDDTWYRRVYSLCHDDSLLRGDITPAYLTLTNNGLQFVHAYNSKMRLIVMLREPVQRALSAARMMLKWKKITRPTDDQWRTVISGNGVVGKSKYATHLENWLQVFPCDQLLIVPYEKISVEPESVMDDICCFLSLSKVKNRSLLNKRIHSGRGYDVPLWVERWLESQLSNERSAVEKMYPFLSQWWK